MKSLEISFFDKLKSNKSRAAPAIALGALAMLLILLSELWPSEAVSPAPQAKSSAEAAAEYQQQLETRLAALISQIDGAGKTTVMITLESGEETIYALDTLSGQTQSQQTHVLLGNGEALEQTIYLPKVCGAAVICEGGGDIYTAARITELVCALLDIPSNRVCVERRGG